MWQFLRKVCPESLSGKVRCWSFHLHCVHSEIATGQPEKGAWRSGCWISGEDPRKILSFSHERLATGKKSDGAIATAGPHVAFLVELYHLVVICEKCFLLLFILKSILMRADTCTCQPTFSLKMFKNKITRYPKEGNHCKRQNSETSEKTEFLGQAHLYFSLFPSMLFGFVMCDTFSVRILSFEIEKRCVKNVNRKTQE